MKKNLTTSPRRKMIFPLLTCLVVIIIGYGYIKINDLIWGTKLTIFEPNENYVSSEEFLKIRGKVEEIKTLFINNAPVLPQENGDFETDLLLARGYNLIEIKITDKFNRQTKKLLEVVYSPNVSPVREFTNIIKSPNLSLEKEG